MKQIRDKYDEIVVDVGGRDTGSLRAALTIAYVVLVPFQPRSVDLWASGQVGALVAEAKAINDALRAYSPITLADTQVRDNEDALSALRHALCRGAPQGVPQRLLERSECNRTHPAGSEGGRRAAIRCRRAVHTRCSP
jgi:cellulose biosynthesis protein BcsQ